MKPRHPLVTQATSLWEAGRTGEALILLNQLAAQNEPYALFALAGLRWRGDQLPQDPVQARELFRRSSDAGHVAGAANYTNLLASGICGPRDWPVGMQRLEQEARESPARSEMLVLIQKMQLDGDGDPLSLPKLERLSASPDVVLFPRLFSAAECQYLLKLAAPLFEPSTVYDSSRRLVRDPLRTSDGATIHWLIENPAVHALNRRLAAITATSADQGEAIQILRYRPGQQYRNHMDFVAASDNQRWMTALVYLNHDYKGGETCFAKTGLRVKARKGDAVVFRNALPDRRPDPMSEHAGLPVQIGEKFIASRWIRERRWAP